jgi:uncharacterized protein RhaS with RHS repeats
MYQPELGRFLQPDPKEFAAGDYNLYRYCHNDPVNKSDPMGLETVVIVGLQRDDSNNLFGHVSVAMTGQGVFSFGTATPWGSSTANFVASQSEHRTQFVYVLPTDAKQESAIRQKLDNQNQKALPDAQNHPINAYHDNCATRTSDALQAGGIDIGKQHTPNDIANKMEERVRDGKATPDVIAPKTSEENLGKLRQFDPDQQKR